MNVSKRNFQILSQRVILGVLILAVCVGACERDKPDFENPLSAADRSKHSVPDSEFTLYAVSSSVDALFTIDPVTGSTRLLGSLCPDPSRYVALAAMAVHPVDGRIFVWNNSNWDSPTGVLLKADPCTGLVRPVNPLAPPQGFLRAMAFSMDGRLFGVGASLCEINVVRGTKREVGLLGADIEIVGASFDPRTGRLYGLDGRSSRLVMIDIDRATATEVARLEPDIGTPAAIAFDSSGKLIGSAYGGSRGDVLFEIDLNDGSVTDVRSISGAPAPWGMGFAPRCNAIHSDSTRVTIDDLTFLDKINPETGELEGGVLLREELDAISDTGERTKSDGYEYSCEHCTVLQYSGNPSNKLDIVFVPTHHYPDAGAGSLFQQDVSLLLQEFHNFPQFEQNMDRFNIYMINEVNPQDSCYEQSYNPVCYPRTNMLRTALQCPGFNLGNNDQIVVVFNDRVLDLDYARAEPKYNAVYIPSGFYAAMMHEFGHSFGKLGDEYDGFINYPFEPEYPNCASLTPGYTCQDKWGDLIGIDDVDCFNNCHALNWYRPTNGKSVMRFYALNCFCAVGERHVNSQLSIYGAGRDPNANCFLFLDLFTACFGSQVGDASYNRRADINLDGTIDVKDVAALGSRFDNDDWCLDQLNHIFRNTKLDFSG